MAEVQLVDEDIERYLEPNAEKKMQSYMKFQNYHLYQWKRRMGEDYYNVCQSCFKITKAHEELCAVCRETCVFNTSGYTLAQHLGMINAAGNSPPRCAGCFRLLRLSTVRLSCCFSIVCPRCYIDDLEEPGPTCSICDQDLPIYPFMVEEYFRTKVLNPGVSILFGNQCRNALAAQVKTMPEYQRKNFEFDSWRWLMDKFEHWRQGLEQKSAEQEDLPLVWVLKSEKNYK